MTLQSGSEQPPSQLLGEIGPIEHDPFGEGTGGRAFAEFIGLRRDGPGVTSLTITPAVLNGAGMLLGPVGFALIDYSMASALWVHRAPGELIATINIALNFVQSADRGEVRCVSRLDRRNRYTASLSSEISHADGRLLVTAVGSFAIRPSHAGAARGRVE